MHWIMFLIGTIMFHVAQKKWDIALKKWSFELLGNVSDQYQTVGMSIRTVKYMPFALE